MKLQVNSTSAKRCLFCNFIFDDDDYQKKAIVQIIKKEKHQKEQKKNCSLFEFYFSFLN